MIEVGGEKVREESRGKWGGISGCRKSEGEGEEERRGRVKRDRRVGGEGKQITNLHDAMAIVTYICVHM